MSKLVSITPNSAVAMLLLSWHFVGSNLMEASFTMEREFKFVVSFTRNLFVAKTLKRELLMTTVINSVY